MKPASLGTVPRQFLDGGLRSLVRWGAPGGARGRLSIAIFHRVFAQPDPLFPDDPDRTAFDAICHWLSSWFQVLPLGRAIAQLQAGTLPERALCITFDDGYADNHDVALPVLKAHGLSATFFIATGFLDGGRMWNDTVVEAVRRSRLERLDLSGLGLPGEPTYRLDTPSARREAIDQLLPSVKYLAPAERLAMVDRIAERAQVDLPADLMMTSAQVRAMADAGMTIGAHTVSHPILARVDEATARREMQQSKAVLQDLLGRPVDLFAYPNGRPGSDYTPRDARLAAEAGFAAAVTTAAGAAAAGDDAFQLPRFTPWARTRTKFGAQLARNVVQARWRA